MNKKQSNKGLIIVIIILCLLLAGALGYIINEKTKTQETKQTHQNKKPDQTILVEGNTFDLNGTSCIKEENSCTKEIQVAYNNQNHNIKIKYILKDDNNLDEHNKYYQASYNLYIDNKLIDTLEGGTIVTNETNDIASQFNAKIYIFDGKYLGFLREISELEGGSGYALTLYNNNNKIDKEQIIKITGQSLCYDNECNKEINVVEDSEFDGNSYKFYQGDCDSKKIVLYSITTDGQTITRSIDKKLKVNYDEAGSGKLGCYKAKDNKISY